VTTYFIIGVGVIVVENLVLSLQADHRTQGSTFWTTNRLLSKAPKKGTDTAPTGMSELQKTLKHISACKLCHWKFEEKIEN
jgi:hypothetical protein